MWPMSSNKLSILPITLGLVLFSTTPVIADSTTTPATAETSIASQPASTPGAEAATTPAMSPPTDTHTTDSITSGAQAATATPDATASTTTSTSAASSNSSEPAPGPLLEKRKLVLSHIMDAKKQGTGISGYLAEYHRIDDMVKAGQPASVYEERLESLSSGINDQLKRSQILKTQRPTGSYSSSSFSGSSSSHGSGGGGNSGGIPSDMINQIKAKYGDKLPAGISDKIGNLSAEQRDKILQSDILKKLLNK